MLVIDVLGELIDAGRIKVYSCDSVAGYAMVRGDGDPRYRAALINGFHNFVRDEMIPAIWADCQTPGAEVVVTGASIGAFNALAVLCRFPDVVSHAIGLSGTYDLEQFVGPDAGDALFFATPLYFLPGLDGPLLDTAATALRHPRLGRGAVGEHRPLLAPRRGARLQGDPQPRRPVGPAVRPRLADVAAHAAPLPRAAELSAVSDTPTRRHATRASSARARWARRWSPASSTAGCSTRRTSRAATRARSGATRLASAHGVAVTADNVAAARDGDIVLLAVKPQMLAGVMAELRGSLRPEQLVISVVAGASTRALAIGVAARRGGAHHAQHARADRPGRHRLVRDRRRRRAPPRTGARDARRRWAASSRCTTSARWPWPRR